MDHCDLCCCSRCLLFKKTFQNDILVEYKNVEERGYWQNMRNGPSEIQDDQCHKTTNLKSAYNYFASPQQSRLSRSAHWHLKDMGSIATSIDSLSFFGFIMIEANFHGAADGEGLQNYILRVTFRMRWLWKWAQAIQILLEFPDWSPTLVGNKIEKSTSAAKPDRSNLLGYGLLAFNSQAHILVKFTYL